MWACHAVQHTSASLTINENASPDVPLDLNVRPLLLLDQIVSSKLSFSCEPQDLLLQDALDKIVPEGHHYRHLDEGLDDMPAHVKVNLSPKC